MSAYVSICQHMSAYVSICTSAYVSQHMSAYVSICQHSSEEEAACVRSSHASSAFCVKYWYFGTICFYYSK